MYYPLFCSDGDSVVDSDKHHNFQKTIRDYFSDTGNEVQSGQTLLPDLSKEYPSWSIFKFVIRILAVWDLRNLTMSLTFLRSDRLTFSANRLSKLHTSNVYQTSNVTHLNELIPSESAYRYMINWHMWLDEMPKAPFF